MADETAVLDEPIEAVETEEIEQPEGVEQPEGAEGAETDPEQSGPYTTRSSREMRAAFKELEAAHPDKAKYLKQARDNHARLFALNQLEPKGIDGVRDKYAMFDSIVDGDMKGWEAVQALQERAQETAQIDQFIANGDRRGLDALGEDFNDGLSKLTPAILDRVAQHNPEVYEAAILPHAVSLLAKSPMLAEYNRAADQLTWALNGRSLKDLPEAEVRQFAAHALNALAGVGTHLNAMSEKAGEIKETPAAQPNDERTQFEKERSDFHWNSRIEPLVAKHYEGTFQKELAAYSRLNLNDAQKSGALKAFRAGIIQAARSDPDFQKQYRIYKAQKNPDAQAVSTFFNAAISRYGKNVMKEVIEERWPDAAKPKPKTATNPTATRTVPKTVSVSGLPDVSTIPVVSAKPDMREIDHRNTPVEFLAQKIYRLNSGKFVRVVAQ